MNPIREHVRPHNLGRFAFYWSMARMVIASISLFFGAMPIAYGIFGYSTISSLLSLAWLISGAASVYLVFRWNTCGQRMFGENRTKDGAAFWIMIITGLNLGYTAIGGNIGMSLISGMPIADLLFKATAIFYLVVAYYLWKRWHESDCQLFEGHHAAVKSSVPKDPISPEVLDHNTPPTETSRGMTRLHNHED